MTFISTAIEVETLVATIIQWQKNKEVEIVHTLKSHDEISQENEAKIQAELARIKDKVRKNK